MTDSLEQLLRSADTAPPAGTPPRGLAVRVRQRRARQQRVTASIVAVGILSSALFLSVNWRTQTKPVAKAPVAPQPVESPLASRIHELTAEYLLQDSESRQPASVASSTAINILEQRDRAALVLIYDAERYTQSNRPTDAVAAYKRAIELFPQSPWADVARQRLRQFQSGMSSNPEENA